MSAPDKSRIALTAVLFLAMTSCERCRSASTDQDSTPTPQSPKRPRIVVLGFDGVDPDRVQALMDDGRLPHLARLASEGHFSPLRSTTPPQSPVAWATFATGRNPGQHGIYDFIHRNPSNYLPFVAYLKIRRPEVEAGKLVRGLQADSLRHGPSFWHRAGEAGVKGSILFVPYSFPPDGVADMRVISGLGTPDIRGTNSTFQYFAEAGFPLEKKPGPVSGGIFTRGSRQGAGWTARMLGPSVKRDGKSDSVGVDVTFTADESGLRLATGQAAARGEWSAPISLEFALADDARWKAVTRMYAVAGRSDPLAAYFSPLSADPRDPPFPISSPPEFSAQLAAVLGGPFKTVGWVHETSGLSTEALDEEGFLSEMRATMDFREKLLLHVLAEGHDELTVAAFTATDRVSHMFYRLEDESHPRFDPLLAKRYGGAIDQTYERMDQIVGRVRKQLPADAILILVSDHGFHSFRRGLNLNRWLVDHGYMTLNEGAEVGRDFFQDVDWSRTRAYALGTGQLWINTAGRESKGIVPAQRSEALAREIGEKLRSLKDGDTLVVPSVHPRSVYDGEQTAGAPDLTVSLASGYRAGWGSILGGAPKDLFEDNERKWSGDHASSDPLDTAGFVVSNRALKTTGLPGIEQVARTVLDAYGVEEHADSWLRD